MTHSASQRGSSFFIILIAIAIFAALSFAVLQGGRVSQSQLSGDQARLAAQDIIQYGDAIGKAVQTLRLRGCNTSELDFTGTYSAPANPSAPSDESCHVFSLNGGKVISRTADPSYYQAGNPWSGTWAVTVTEDILGVGTNGCTDGSCTDVILTLSDLKQDVCAAIEKILGSGTIPEDDDVYKYTFFDGSNFESTPNVIGDDPNGETLQGRGAACLQETSDGAFVFYQVLVAR